MKYYLTIIAIFTFQVIFAQNYEIDSDNYYDFYNKTSDNPITTNWLRRTEIVPIIQEELERYGFKNNFEFKLYKLDNNQFIILEMYNEQFNFGIVYKTGHSAKPQKEDRSKESNYEITYFNSSGESSGYININLPSNIYLLDENWYWYQYHTDKYKSNDYVNRDVIIKIFREDVRKILANYKNLDKALEETKWQEVYPSPLSSNFIFVDNWPKFVDGEKGLEKYISENVQYPEKARKNKIEEEIIIEYEIKADGNIGDINVIQGENQLLIDEAKRVIKNMPKWKPAKQNGKAISIKYEQEFNFKL